MLKITESSFVKEKQKTLFGTKKLQQPTLINKQKIRAFYEPAGIRRAIAAVDRRAAELEKIELGAAGVTEEKFRAIAEALNAYYEDNGLSLENWPYTERLHRTAIAINAEFKVYIEAFHIWQIMIFMRKKSVLATYDFDKGKKRKMLARKRKKAR